MRENYTVLTIYMYIIDLVQFERRRSWGEITGHFPVRQ